MALVGGVFGVGLALGVVKLEGAGLTNGKNTRVLIDGGVGQLHAAADALQSIGVTNQPRRSSGASGSAPPASARAPSPCAPRPPAPRIPPVTVRCAFGLSTRDTTSGVTFRSTVMSIRSSSTCRRP